MIGHRIFALFTTQKVALRHGVNGKAQDLIRVNRAQLEASYLPPWWKDEAKTVEEWFIRLCRNLGFHAVWDPDNKRFEVRLIKNEADQALIEIPGIDNVNAPKHAKVWGHEKGES